MQILVRQEKKNLNYFSKRLLDYKTVGDVVYVTTLIQELCSWQMEIEIGDAAPYCLILS